ncbi:Cytochrome c oxidase subunit Va/VI, partial [Penicillium cf. griseofulvum]
PPLEIKTAVNGVNRMMTQHPPSCLRRQHHTTRKILEALLTSPSRLHPHLSPHHCYSPVHRGPLPKMSSLSIFRVATRAVRPTGFFRAPQLTRSRMQSPVTLAAARAHNFGTTPMRRSGHEDETFEEFSARFEKEFDGVQDVFELQRNLNNCFAYDLVPSVEVLTAALKAARRVNDFPTAVRVFEGIKAKVENPEQYKQYLESLEGLRVELGVALREELYPQEA